MLGFWIALVFLFLVANRGAYKGYFSDDDFDNLANARGLEVTDLTHGLSAPLLQNSFRVTGFLYYFAMVRLAGLQFAAYIAVMHALHLLNVGLLWFVLRRLNIARTGAAAGCLLFAFHMACFGIYWKPMYIFDLACGVFTLLCILSWFEGRVVLSVICFWLAFKAKEAVILLPLVLAEYEWRLGEGRWKKLMPFFAISALFGAQALFLNAGRASDYALRFTPAAVWQCVSFYSSELLLIPYAGLALIALPFLARDRRFRFGLLAFGLLLATMLALPGRLFAAYLYVPLAGLAIAFAAVARPAWAALFFLAWWPWNYYHLRLNRRDELAGAAERRAWMSGVAAFASRHPEVDTYIWDGTPESFFTRHGITGALLNLRPSVTVRSREDPDVVGVMSAKNLAVIVWDQADKKVTVLARAPDVPYINMGPLAPLWQLGEGWYGGDAAHRWIQPRATARLWKPAGEHVFEMTTNPNETYIRGVQRSELEVRLNGELIGRAEITEPRLTTLRWPVPSGVEGAVQIEFRVSPPFKTEGGELGLPIMAFGFVSP